MNYEDMDFDELLEELEIKYQQLEMTDSEAAMYILLKRLIQTVRKSSAQQNFVNQLLSMPIEK